jgi:hypothetical protein
LWVITCALGILGIAGVTEALWLVLAIPFAVAGILFAPPIGVFKHDELPPPRTGARLHQREVPALPSDPPGARRFLLTLVNEGAVAAESFRIRLMVPAAIWPRGTRGSPLGALHVGTIGRHWFVETVYNDTSVTLRAGAPGEAGSLTCGPGERLDLAELMLVNLAQVDLRHIEYQINGGTVQTVLGRVELPTC